MYVKCRSNYGSCSQSCFGGVMFRSNVHTCTNVEQQDSAPCGEEGSYMDWSSWSECSDPCSGTRTRRQVHTCGAVDIVEEEVCLGPSKFFISFTITN